MEFIDENFKSNLNYCGKDVRLYPLCKMIRAENAKLDNNDKIFEHVFISTFNENIIRKTVFYLSVDTNITVFAALKLNVDKKTYCLMNGR